MTATTAPAEPGAAETDDVTSQAQTASDKAEALLDTVVQMKGGARRPGQVQMAREVADGITRQRPRMEQGGTGIGKALDVNTPIPTPRGFVPIGDLTVDDEVYDENGKVCSVTHAFDVLEGRTCYEVTFSDGSTIVADAEHLWNTVPRGARSTPDWVDVRTATTEEIGNSLTGPGGRWNHLIPLAGTLEGHDTTLAVEPYALGVWLAGTMTRTVAARALAEHVPSQLLGFDMHEEGRYRCFTPTAETYAALENLGMFDGDGKHIPRTYLFAAERYRWHLLAGLLDAGAYVVGGQGTQRNPGGQVQFTNVLHRLASDVQTLACTLGFRVTCSPRLAKPKHTAEPEVVTWRVAFSPAQQVFRSPKKAARLGHPDGTRRSRSRSIVKVTLVESRPVRCISVDSPNHLYLAGHTLIPTHNSIAYLVGALATERQTVVAPHTKALQDQLSGDLELIEETFADSDNPLGKSPQHAVVKGRGAYACRAKIEGTNEIDDAQETLINEPASGPSSELGQQVAALHEWAGETETGDRADVPFPVTGKAWSMVSVNADNCTGKACPFWKDNTCFAERARRQAAEADIIVVNQALLAMSMRFPQLLPETVGAVIVDEAHEFPEVVANTFGAQVTPERLRNAIKQASALEESGKATVEKLTQAAEQASQQLDTALTPTPRRADRGMFTKPEIDTALEQCALAFGPFASQASLLRESDEDEKSKKDLLVRMYENVNHDLAVLRQGTTDKQVAWVEPNNNQTVLRAAQFDVGATIASRLIHPFKSVLLTSATLTIANRFDMPAERFGLNYGPWDGQIVPSPFNYPKQGLLYLPSDMPEPSAKPDKSAEYLAAVASTAEQVARAADGRTLVLCTSRDAVTTVAAHLQHTLGDTYPVLVQEPGEPTKPLARRFADEPNSILVGTRTFWTGVSVEGPTCSAVVVDKIPFPNPQEPIISARSEKADREHGRMAGFKEVSMPEAVLTMVQGVGRLIRTVHDRGVVVVCDPRTNKTSDHFKFYARDILASLPSFPVTRDKQQALNFLGDIAATADDTQNQAEIEETPDDDTNQR